MSSIKGDDGAVFDLWWSCVRGSEKFRKGCSAKILTFVFRVLVRCLRMKLCSTLRVFSAFPRSRDDLNASTLKVKAASHPGWLSSSLLTFVDASCFGGFREELINYRLRLVIQFFKNFPGIILMSFSKFLFYARK